MKYRYRNPNLIRATLLGLLAAIILPLVFADRLLSSVSAGSPANESSRPDSDQSKVAAIANRYGKLPLRFEVNEGQADGQVKFLSRGPGYDLFLTASGALLSLRGPNPPLEKCDPTTICPGPPSVALRKTTLLRLTMIGANSAARVEGRDELPGKINYLIGNNQDHWHTNISTYLKVHYTAVYPGVDLVYYGNRTELEYDFIVAAGGDLKAIKFQLDGADRITLDRDGNLLLAVKQSEVKLRKPLIYQLSDEGDRREVKGEYVLQGKQVGFKVKSFDRRKPLIIDPVLSYSTLLGSGGNEYGYGIAVDPSGNAYITGSGSVPTTPGAFQTTAIADAAFITKLDATGSNLVYSTYLGGSNGSSLGNAIAVDASGKAYVTGRTNSSDFPTVNGVRGGGANFYKTLDSGAHWNGQVIGPTGGGVNVLAVDPLAPNTMYAGMNLNAGGGIYKTTDGGITWNALNTGLTTPYCAALAVDPATPTTLYASLTLPLGSSSSGVYKSVNGGTSWSQLTTGLSGVTVSALAIDPVSPSTVYAGASFGVYKSTNGGASWANSSTGINFGGTVAIAIDPNNPQTVYINAGGGGVFKTSNGGGNWAQANTGLTTSFVRTLNIDSASNIYAGTSGGGIFKSTNAAGNWNPITGSIAGFIDVSSVAFNPAAPTGIYFGTGNGRIYKTVDGGSNWTLVYETLTRTTFRALVLNSAAPATVYAAADTAFGSLTDYEAFVSKLNASGSGLVYSTYLGGGSDDFGNAIAIDVNGNAVVAGQTASTGFPRVNAYQSTIAGSNDGFVAKFNLAGDALLYSTYLGGTNSDTVNGIAVDAAGNAYVAGTTGSSNFPLANAFQSTFGGGSFGADAFATKFNADGTLGYSTYLGGSDSDGGFAIAVDASGNAYVTGNTGSANFPIANAPNGAGAAGGAFVTKLNNLGSGLIYSTYLGGPGATTGRGIAADAAGNAYVTGFTASDFPVVAGALQTRSAFFRSDNSGGNWSNDNYGLKGSIASLALDPLSPSTVFASTSNGFYKSANGGNSWSFINTPGIPSFAEIVVDPITPANLFAVSSNTFSGTSGVYRSTNGGNSWTRVVNGMTNSAVLSLAVDPLTPTTLYAGTYGGPLFKSVNSGDGWAPVGSPALDFTNSIAIDPTNANTIYAANNISDGGLFKSVDAGVTWQAVGSAQMGSFCTFVAVNPLAHAKVYASCNTGLFRSVDSGNTWTLAGPYGFTKTVFDPVNSSTIYLVTTAQGILKSVDDGQTWQAINNGLRSTAAVSLKLNPAKPATFYAAMASSSDNDAFVTKINPSGSALIYSTYLGGSQGDFFVSNNNDFGTALAIDSTGNAYVTGESRSLDFPTNQNSYQPFNRGFSDAFVSKVTMSYSIAGQVLDGSNAPVSGAEITLSDGATVSTVLSESDGSYQFSHLREGGSFTVNAAKPHFTITPQSQTFNNLTSNQTLNFLANPTAAPFFTIHGSVTNNGVGLSGVTVILSGSQPGVRTTDSSGNYSFTLAGAGDYTLTPSIVGFIFSPSSRTFNNLSADQTSDFAATRQNFVVTNANDHGAGSLRQAMLDANATAGLDTISFNIPVAGVQTINLLAVLPEITDPVVIDAATQPGYAGSPLVELNGFSVGTSNANGFFITSGGSTIRGFAINRFNRNGIYLSTSDNNVIQGNYVGTDATGSIRRANNYGIEVYKSSNNTIGGTTPAARNVVSGNSFYGISMYGSNNQITGNFIGTNAAGTANLGNGISGIEIVNLDSPPATNNVIGGTTPGAGNLISGNQRGISIGSAGQLVLGNLIGTDVSGTMAVPNGTGISASFPGIVIGGTVAGSRNIISGNSGDGVAFGGPGSRLEGNFIGTDITGTRTLGNGGSGVVAGNGCLIGGTTAAARNVISGNGGNGNISLGSNSSGQHATVQGNYIGTDVTGNIALNNPSYGISISGSSNLIGGLVPGAPNVISGNVTGIQIGGSIFPGPEGNIVQGNLIGLNALGTAPLGNSFTGVSVSGSSNNVIGGTTAGAANKISFNGGSGFNGGAGVMVFSGTGNSVRGNSIFANNSLGIDLNGDGVTANDSSDADTGPNNLQNFPLLTSISSNGSTTTIQGTLNSKPNTVFQIDFYSNAACDPSGNGEGARFFDTTSITTDGSGNATINFVSSQPLPAGRVISATATDPTGNTSEFSACDVANAAGSVQFSSATYSVLEDVGNATITLVRSGGSKGTVSVNYSTADVTATAGSDYTAASGTVVFADGETSKTFSVPIVNDGVTEPAETARLTLTTADLENLGTPAAATLTILDNSTPLVLDTNQVSVLEGNSGARNAIVTVSLSAATGRTVTVNFATSGSSATSGVDFTPVSGTLTFTPGTTTQTISIPVIGDTLNEANENFFIDLSNPVNATVQSSGFVQIVNDDPLPSLSISDLSITEGNSGTVSAVFTVSLSTASGRGLSVGYSTASGTATAGSDFVTTSGRVSFSAGETIKTLSVQVSGDTVAEPDETFFVNLSAPANAAISDNQAIGTILNDDGAGPMISFSQANYTVGESAGAAVITVNRSGDTSGVVTVDYSTSEVAPVSACSTVNGIASSRCDFTTALGTLRFAAGESSKTFTVLISQDNYVEGPESLMLTLANLSGGAVFAVPATASLTITDDASEPPANPINDADVFVRQHYHDFLNREPDAGGLAFWSNQITECQQPGATCSVETRRINVSAAFFLSIEFQETGYLVERIYKAAYGDALGTSNFGPTHQLPVPVVRFNEFLPDTQAIGRDVVVGVGDWQTQLENNKVAFTQSFVARARFVTAYPVALPPADFVDALFAHAGVTPLASERTSIINEFGGAGNTTDVAARARALRRVAENSTLKQQETNKAFVLMQYFGYLRRNPNDQPDSDYSGYDFWLTKLNEFNGNFVNAEMVKAFIVSGEYRQRYGL